MRIFVVTVAKRHAIGVLSSPEVQMRIDAALNDPVWLNRTNDRRESWQSRSGVVRIDAVTNEPDSTGPLIHRYPSGNAGVWTGHIDDPSFAADRPDPARVADLPGCFALVAATDDGADGFTCVHRIEPLYVAEGPDVYVLSSRARTAHLVAGIADRTPPLDALLGLTGAGYMINDSTPFPGVTAVPANTHLAVGPTGRRERELPKLDIDPATPVEELGDRMAAALVTAARALAGGPPVSVQLTGGKDSRIAAVAMAAAGIEFTAMTFGRPTHPDVIVAAQVAGILGIPHNVVTRSTSTSTGVRIDPMDLAYNTLRGCEGMLSAFELAGVGGTYQADKVTIGSAAAEIIRGGYPFGWEAASRRVVVNRFLNHFAPHYNLLTPQARARMNEVLAPWLEVLKRDAFAGSVRFALAQWAGRWYGVERAPHTIGGPVRGIQVDNQVARLAAVADPVAATEGRLAHAAIHSLRPDLCQVPYVGGRWRFEQKGPTPYCDPDRWAEREGIPRRGGTSWDWRESYSTEMHHHMVETILAAAPLFDGLLDFDKTDDFLSGGEQPDRSYLHTRLTWAMYTTAQLLAGLGSQAQPVKGQVFEYSAPAAVLTATPSTVELVRRRPTRPKVDGPELTQCTLCDETFDRAAVPTGVCPGCGLGSEQRGLGYVLNNHGNVFHGRAVLAVGPAASIPRGLLDAAADVRTVDWSASDEPVLSDVSDGSLDAVAVFNPPGPISPNLVERAARILRPGGVLVGIEPAAPAPVMEGDAPRPALAELADAAGLQVTVIPGLDPVLRRTPLVVLAYRPTAPTA